MAREPEAWLRGPVAGIPPLLMPAAHALIQAREDTAAALASTTRERLWARPGASASAGFHLIHLAGALERLYTYARGAELDAAQTERLARERRGDDATLSPAAVGAIVDRAVELALEQLASTPEASLLEIRVVGRARLPATVAGLLFHGAEHATRHVGQCVTVLKALETAS
ncbi:MAG: DinB family protein [Vicinamibacterales bacterium]